MLWEARRSLAAFAMPNRKATRNAYYFFVQEKIPELRRRGLPVARVADAIPYCSADWAVRPKGSARRTVGRREGEARARPEGTGLEGVSDPEAPAWGRGAPRVPPAREKRTPEPQPRDVQALAGESGALRPHRCCSSCRPCNVRQLLSQDEKEKYADMARAWRAAQGKDCAPSEKQVKAARAEQLPAWPRPVRRCWMSERGGRGHAGAAGWRFGLGRAKVFISLPGVTVPVTNPAGSPSRRTLVSFGGAGGGSPIREPASEP